MNISKEHQNQDEHVHDAKPSDHPDVRWQARPRALPQRAVRDVRGRTAPIANREHHSSRQRGEPEGRPTHISMGGAGTSPRKPIRNSIVIARAAVLTSGQCVTKGTMPRGSCRPGMSDTQHGCTSDHTGDELDQGRHLLRAGQSGEFSRLNLPSDRHISPTQRGSQHNAEPRQRMGASPVVVLGMPRSGVNPALMSGLDFCFPDAGMTDRRRDQSARRNARGSAGADSQRGAVVTPIS